MPQEEEEEEEEERPAATLLKGSLLVSLRPSPTPEARHAQARRIIAGGLIERASRPGVLLADL
jgi:hypothetical protein